MIILFHKYLFTAVATVLGIIFGSHALDWFSPLTWNGSDALTFEFTRIVLVVQIFSLVVDLPKKTHIAPLNVSVCTPCAGNDS